MTRDILVQILIKLPNDKVPKVGELVTGIHLLLDETCNVVRRE